MTKPNPIPAQDFARVRAMASVIADAVGLLEGVDPNATKETAAALMRVLALAEGAVAASGSPPSPDDALLNIRQRVVERREELERKCQEAEAREEKAARRGRRVPRTGLALGSAVMALGEALVIIDEARASSGSPPPTVWQNAFDRLTQSCVEHFGHLPGDYDAIVQDAVDGGQNFDLMAALKGALAKPEPSASGSPPSRLHASEQKRRAMTLVEALADWRKYWETDLSDDLILTGKQADELCVFLNVPFDGVVRELRAASGSTGLTCEGYVLPLPSHVERHGEPFPRRNCVDQWTNVERAIHAAHDLVEHMPPSLHLTDAGNLLLRASEKVADYLEGKPHALDVHINTRDEAGVSHPVPAPLAEAVQDAAAFVRQSEVSRAGSTGAHEQEYREKLWTLFAMKAGWVEPSAFADDVLKALGRV